MQTIRRGPSGGLSLYLHIPFCQHRCSYCDFNTYTTVGSLKDKYAAALSKEIEQVGRLGAHQDQPQMATTIFFGGGTPSLMSPANLELLLQSVRRSFDLAAGAEISLEANPGTVDQSYLAAIQELGVNRISLGVQSADATELALLERQHDFQTVVDAVAMCREAALDNFNLDLIYGVPGQTLGTWEQSLRAALALQPAHLSLYCLTIEPGTPMQRWLNQGRISPPDADLAADQYELACELLPQHGFVHYEISNWAQPGFECRHNLAYWRNQEYLGLGAGAHGHAAGLRYQVVKQPRVYIRRMQLEVPDRFPLSAAAAEYHLVERTEAISDTVITQLRLLQEGLDLGQFQLKFGQTLDEVYAGKMGQLITWGLLEERNGRLLLSRRGRFLSNQVFYRFMQD